ncbi:C40 family peptidase [Myxococcus sp. AS-1-15]|uniref:C40 family peptidase n=1 Tax=Myxococcus sp. AS-1-15 TaxID=2874600 RepID=UPI001CBD0FF4|nr:C40 family peptidase [Myxococcus sp. AS-1-15]MBZ4402465.1 C40 family peptidase [Myxococcus sp. AS-1-15]
MLPAASLAVTLELVAAALSHAREESPRESCGLIARIAGELRYRRCRNLAEGHAHFHLSPEDFALAEAEGEVVAVVHSHPNASPEPSEADRVMCERWGLPWLIVNVPVGHWQVLCPSGYRARLVGRPFSHGVLDCFSLIRDYYAEVVGLDLPDFERPDDWWQKGGNLYLEGYERAGFVDVTGAPLREHDVLLMQLRAPVPNHAGVYLGADVVLHHLQASLSRRETYSGFWERITRRVVRHRSLC